MNDVAITRITGQSQSLTSQIAPTSHFDVHTYPFTTLGPLTSHAHPHFVLFNAGEKFDFDTLSKLSVLKDCMHLRTMEEAKSYASRIKLLYVKWTSEPCSSVFKLRWHSFSSGAEDSIESDNEEVQSRGVSSKKSVLVWRRRASETAMDNGGWEPDVWNDNQLGEYIKEHPHLPGEEWQSTRTVEEL